MYNDKSYAAVEATLKRSNAGYYSSLATRYATATRVLVRVDGTEHRSRFQRGRLETLAGDMKTGEQWFRYYALPRQ